MEEEKYSLRNLAAIVGIEPRTIRWYISEGLLRGPESRGRNAHYTDQHLKRLKMIRLLKEVYGLPLERIRRQVMMAGDENLEEVHEQLHERTTHRAEAQGEPQLNVPRGVQQRARWRRGKTRGPGSQPPSSLLDDEVAEVVERATNVQEPKTNAPVQDLLKGLRDVLGDRRVPRQARSKEVLKVDVTPEVALEIRGQHSPEEIALFEMLADHLREVLLGGTDRKTEDIS
jgi:DNA-binding transcriptional MerR regulator